MRQPRSSNDFDDYVDSWYEERLAAALVISKKIAASAGVDLSDALRDLQSAVVEAYPKSRSAKTYPGQVAATTKQIEAILAARPRQNDRWIYHGPIGHSGANKGCGPDACSPSKLPALLCPLCLPGESMASVTPLSGIVVIEIGHSIAAPYAGMILGELGAEVIKVENPKGGDACRGWGPPFQEGAATCFHAVNRGQARHHGRSRRPGGGGAAARADPGARRCRDPQSEIRRARQIRARRRRLIAAKPSLVCCNLGAFGATGPLRDRPGYDPMMQAYSGLMSLLGEDGRPPVRVTASIIDMGAAMWSVIGILAALAGARPHRQGRHRRHLAYETGARLDEHHARRLSRQPANCRRGTAPGVDMIVPYQAFAARDGYMMVAAGNDNLFRRLCAALGRPGLAEDPRFRTNGDRVVNRAELVPILADIFATEPRAEWARLLDRPASRTGRSTRSTRSSPTRRPRRSA